MAICEFNELYCVIRGGGYGCLCLVRVRNMVFLLACSVLTMRWTVLLCLAIMSPFRYGCNPMHIYMIKLMDNFNCLMLNGITLVQGFIITTSNISFKVELKLVCLVN